MSTKYPSVTSLTLRQAAKEDAKALDCILESYSNFGQHLPLIAVYRSQLRQQPETRICLAWMYSDLLQFNASIIKLFQIRSKSTIFPIDYLYPQSALLTLQS